MVQPYQLDEPTHRPDGQPDPDAHASLRTDLTFGEYREIDAVNASSLKDLSKSPADALWRQSHPLSLPQFTFGSAAHCHLLERNDFDLLYAARPEGLDLRTKAGKAWKELVGDREVLSADDMRAIEAMTMNVKMHPHAGDMVRDSVHEVTITWDDPETGVPCKARLDMFAEGCFIADYKTAQDISPKAMRRTLIDYGYALSAAYYTDAVYLLTGQVLPFYVVAARKTPPHPVEVYWLDDDVIDYGRREYRRLLNEYAVCRELDEWPLTSGEINPLGLPAWVK